MPLNRANLSLDELFIPDYKCATSEHQGKTPVVPVHKPPSAPSAKRQQQQRWQQQQQADRVSDRQSKPPDITAPDWYLHLNMVASPASAAILRTLDQNAGHYEQTAMQSLLGNPYYTAAPSGCESKGGLVQRLRSLKTTPIVSPTSSNSSSSEPLAGAPPAAERSAAALPPHRASGIPVSRPSNGRPPSMRQVRPAAGRGSRPSSGRSSRVHSAGCMPTPPLVLNLGASSSHPGSRPTSGHHASRIPSRPNSRPPSARSTLSDVGAHFRSGGSSGMLRPMLHQHLATSEQVVGRQPSLLLAHRFVY